MIFTKLLQRLQDFAPEHLAASYDNIGYQIGWADKDVHKVCIATDATDSVIAQAVERGADLLISHHPVIWQPLTKVLAEDYSGGRVISLIRADINYITMHTNFDVAHMGRRAADILGLLDCRVFEVTHEGAATAWQERERFDADMKKAPAQGTPSPLGYGRVGRLPTPMTLADYTAHVRQSFELDSVRVYGNSSGVIASAAIMPGSSSSDAPQYAAAAAIDLYITGEIKHSLALEMLARGISVIEAGHFGTEKIFVPAMIEFFGRELPEVEVFAATESSPWAVVSGQ